MVFIGKSQGINLGLCRRRKKGNLLCLELTPEFSFLAHSHTSLVMGKNTWLRFILDSMLFHKQLLICASSTLQSAYLGSIVGGRSSFR